MLEGLRMMKDNWAMASYAETTAVSIWCQLSDYARDRITGTLVNLMGLDASWYEEISDRAESVQNKMFYVHAIHYLVYQYIRHLLELN